MTTDHDRDRPGTDRPDPDDLPDGSGTAPENPDDGKDTASGGGADDR